MGVIAEISTRVKKEFYGYRKEKQLMFNFMDCFFFVTSGCPDGYYGKHCNRTCLCEVTHFCHPSYGCIRE